MPDSQKRKNQLKIEVANAIEQQCAAHPSDMKEKTYVATYGPYVASIKKSCDGFYDKGGYTQQLLDEIEVVSR